MQSSFMPDDFQKEYQEGIDFLESDNPDEALREMVKHCKSCTCPLGEIEDEDD